MGPDNLILAQLRGLRRELAVVPETQTRDRELFTRHADRVEEAVARIDKSIGDLRSDSVLLENKLLTQTNEILTILRRFDEMGLDDGEPDTAASDLDR